MTIHIIVINRIFDVICPLKLTTIIQKFQPHLQQKDNAGNADMLTQKEEDIMREKQN